LIKFKIFVFFFFSSSLFSFFFFFFFFFFFSSSSFILQAQDLLAYTALTAAVCSKHNGVEFKLLRTSSITGPCVATLKVENGRKDVCVSAAGAHAPVRTVDELLRLLNLKLHELEQCYLDHLSWRWLAAHFDCSDESAAFRAARTLQERFDEKFANAKDEDNAKLRKSVKVHQLPLGVWWSLLDSRLVVPRDVGNGFSEIDLCLSTAKISNIDHRVANQTLFTLRRCHRDGAMSVWLRGLRRLRRGASNRSMYFGSLSRALFVADGSAPQKESLVLLQYLHVSSLATADMFKTLFASWQTGDTAAPPIVASSMLNANAVVIDAVAGDDQNSVTSESHELVCAVAERLADCGDAAMVEFNAKVATLQRRPLPTSVMFVSNESAGKSAIMGALLCDNHDEPLFLPGHDGDKNTWLPLRIQHDKSTSVWIRRCSAAVFDDRLEMSGDAHYVVPGHYVNEAMLEEVRSELQADEVVLPVAACHLCSASPEIKRTLLLMAERPQLSFDDALQEAGKMPPLAIEEWLNSGWTAERLRECKQVQKVLANFVDRSREAWFSIDFIDVRTPWCKEQRVLWDVPGLGENASEWRLRLVMNQWLRLWRNSDGALVANDDVADVIVMVTPDRNFKPNDIRALARAGLFERRFDVSANGVLENVPELHFIVNGSSYSDQEQRAKAKVDELRRDVRGSFERVAQDTDGKKHDVRVPESARAWVEPLGQHFARFLHAAVIPSVNIANGEDWLLRQHARRAVDRLLSAVDERHCQVLLYGLLHTARELINGQPDTNPPSESTGDIDTMVSQFDGRLTRRLRDTDDNSEESIRSVLIERLREHADSPVRNRVNMLVRGSIAPSKCDRVFDVLRELMTDSILTLESLILPQVVAELRVVCDEEAARCAALSQVHDSEAFERMLENDVAFKLRKQSQQRQRVQRVQQDQAQAETMQLSWVAPGSKDDVDFLSKLSRGDSSLEVRCGRIADWYVGRCIENIDERRLDKFVDANVRASAQLLRAAVRGWRCSLGRQRELGSLHKQCTDMLARLLNMHDVRKDPRPLRVADGFVPLRRHDRVANAVARDFDAFPLRSDAAVVLFEDSGVSEFVRVEEVGDNDNKLLVRVPGAIQKRERKWRNEPGRDGTMFAVFLVLAPTASAERVVASAKEELRDIDACLFVMTTNRTQTESAQQAVGTPPEADSYAAAQFDVLVCECVGKGGAPLHLFKRYDAALLVAEVFHVPLAVLLPVGEQQLHRMTQEFTCLAFCDSSLARLVVRAEMVLLCEIAIERQRRIDDVKLLFKAEGDEAFKFIVSYSLPARTKRTGLDARTCDQLVALEKFVRKADDDRDYAEFLQLSEILFDTNVCTLAADKDGVVFGGMYSAPGTVFERDALKSRFIELGCAEDDINVGETFTVNWRVPVVRRLFETRPQRCVASTVTSEVMTVPPAKYPTYSVTHPRSMVRKRSMFCVDVRAARRGGAFAPKNSSDEALSSVRWGDCFTKQLAFELLDMYLLPEPRELIVRTPAGKRLAASAATGGAASSSSSNKRSGNAAKQRRTGKQLFPSSSVIGGASASGGGKVEKKVDDMDTDEADEEEGKD
jgi:hypothetical protein